MMHANDNTLSLISTDSAISIDTLERCLDRVAIAMHRAPQGGEIYLPIFERLEREIALKKANESAMSRALRRIRR